MQGIAGSADEHRCSNFLHGSQALEGIHSASRDGERAKSLGSFVGRPEADEGTKAKGEKNNIIGTDTCRSIDAGPTIRPPIPTFLGIEDFQGAAGGAGGL